MGKQEESVAPKRRLSNQHNGSDLYDSFELGQMTHQLNKAIQASNDSSPAHQEMTHQLYKAIQGPNASSPAFVLHLNSPFYQRHLNRIYREGAKTPRRIPGPQAPDKRACGTGARERGFVARLWLKVKRGLLGKKPASEGGRNRPSHAY